MTTYKNLQLIKNTGVIKICTELIKATEMKKIIIKFIKIEEFF